MCRRAALIVGINQYAYMSPLGGCVNDAESVEAVLETHENGDRNFDVIDCLVSGAMDKPISESDLRGHIRALFAEDYDIALFYFAGHGQISERGGCLLASDSKAKDSGISMASILTVIRNSPARNKIIILDCCHSGGFGDVPMIESGSILPDGIIIMTASTDTQVAMEQGGRGTFSSLLVDAMKGSASDLSGKVSPAMLYAQIDQAMGTLKQRPVFKANIKDFISLRSNRPTLKGGELRKIGEYFGSEGEIFRLDPSFEPLDGGRHHLLPSPNKQNVKKFRLLQKLRACNLVTPLDCNDKSIAHMWDAAMYPDCEYDEVTESTRYGACKLTPLGEHYRRLKL